MAGTILFRISRLPEYDCKDFIAHLLFCMDKPLAEKSTKAISWGVKEAGPYG